MRKSTWAAALFAVGVLCAAARAEYIVGADVSFLAQAEQQGVVFKENGQAKPGMQIFRDHGYNWVRLRLFHTPGGAVPAATQAATRPGRGGGGGGRQGLPNDLPYTIKMAKDAKKLGFKVLLDYHYADSWADPGKQPIPAAWQGQTHEQLVTSVREYTRDTLKAFAAEGAFPEMVQIGNEITNGMMWPDGRLWRQGGGEEPGGWERFTDLLKAGTAGVEEAVKGAERVARPRIMIHIDRGGDQRTTKRFYDQMVARGVAFDVIGQSYYPWWHGSLLDLRDNLKFMAETYQKDIVLAEVAYCWRPTEYRDAPGPFPESPEGQRAFLEAVNKVVMEAPGGRGIGVMWWEPAVSPRNGIASRGMFDAEGNALPAVGAMDAWVRGKVPRRVP